MNLLACHQGIGYHCKIQLFKNKQAVCQQQALSFQLPPSAMLWWKIPLPPLSFHTSVSSSAVARLSLTPHLCSQTLAAPLSLTPGSWFSHICIRVRDCVLFKYFPGLLSQQVMWSELQNSHAEKHVVLCWVNISLQCLYQAWFPGSPSLLVLQIVGFRVRFRVRLRQFFQ